MPLPINIHKILKSSRVEWERLREIKSDRVLTRHYGFTEEEPDFVINCDIKYPHGAGG